MKGHFEPELTEPLYKDTSESYEDDSEVEIILMKTPLKKVEQQRKASPLKQDPPENVPENADQDKAASEPAPMQQEQQSFLYVKNAKLINRLLEK